MSLLWPDRRRVALSPEAVGVAAVRRFRRRPLLRDVWRCEPEVGAASWKASVDVLAAGIASGHRSAVSIVLSNHYCQFAVLEKPAAVTGDEEALRYAKLRMQALHGDAAKEWDIELSASGKSAWLVCCTPRALLEAIRRIFAARRVRIASIQPYFAAAWNRRGAAIRGRGGWFVVHESKCVVIGLIANGRWMHLAARRCGPGLDDVLDVVDREREAISYPGAGRKVWLYGSTLPHAPADYRDYEIELVEPPRVGEVELSKRALYAMAA